MKNFEFLIRNKITWCLLWKSIVGAVKAGNKPLITETMIAFIVKPKFTKLGL